MCPEEMPLPLRMKYKEQYYSLRRTPTKRYKGNDMMQALIFFTNLVGNREGTTFKKNNRDKKSNSKCYMLLSVCSGTSLWPPVKTEGTWPFTICRPSCVVVLTSFTSQSHSPHAFHQSLSSWLVWLVEWRILASLFFPVEVQLETYINTL